jgi:hypothetical protein
MTVSLTHKLVVSIADDAAAKVAGEVVPSNWNDQHALTGAANTILGFNGSGAAVELTTVLQTYAGASDPAAANDSTQGYSAGSLGVNSSSGRAFVCRSAAAGAAVWAPLAPGQVGNIIAGNWFVPERMQNTGNGTAIASTTTLTLVPFLLRERCTINGLGAKIFTAGSSNSQFGLYAASPTTGLPTGNVLINTGNIANTALGPASASVANTQIEAGMYYFAVEQNDATVVYAAVSQTNSLLAVWPGASSLNSLSASNATSTLAVALSTTISAFGFWPSLTSASFNYLINSRNAAGFLSAASVP